jgi:hypothetical protein
MAIPPASRIALRLVTSTTRQSLGPTRTVPFFSQSSSSSRSLPFFYPSQQHLPFAVPRNTFFNPSTTPSPTFASLRTAFHTSSQPFPSRGPPLQRGFSSTSKASGIRPYYGNTTRGRKPPGWKDRINSIEHVWVLGGLIGEFSPFLSRCPPPLTLYYY